MAKEEPKIEQSLYDSLVEDLNDIQRKAEDEKMTFVYALTKNGRVVLNSSGKLRDLSYIVFCIQGRVMEMINNK